VGVVTLKKKKYAPFYSRSFNHFSKQLLKRALLLNVINSRQAHHQLKTHLQASSPVAMEMQIPAALG